MKKIISIILVNLLVSSVLIPVFAKVSLPSDDGNTVVRTVTENGYAVTITEAVTETQQIVRTYQKQTLKEDAVRSFAESEKEEQAKAILAALGMTEQYISDIPENTLLESVDCEQIVATISYTKSDAEGNVTYISEAEMQMAAATVSEKPEDTYEDNDTDEYMTITHVVYCYSNGRFKFATNARWLTMPFFRETDSIGSCAQDIARIPGSEYGVIRYTNTTYYSYPLTGEPKESVQTREISDKRNISYAAWDGSAGVFDLPIDAYSQEINIITSDFRAYYEFDAYVRYPGDEIVFNSVGTYAHTQMTLNFSPDLTIEPGKGVAFSIGVSTADTEERRSVEMQLHYIPN